MLMGSSTSAVFTWLAQLKEFNGKIRELVQKSLPEAEPSEMIVDRRVQELCRQYEVINHLIEIVKLMFRERTLKAWSEVFSDILLTLRVVSIDHSQNSQDIYPLLDHFIKHETDRQVNSQIQWFIAAHPNLLSYFSTFRELGQKGNDMLMPLECLVSKLQVQEEIADRVSMLRLIEEVCCSNGRPEFLSQEGVFRAVREESFKRQRILLEIQSADRIYVESYQLRSAVDDLLQKIETKNIRDLLQLLEEQLVLVASLTANCHREAVKHFLEQYRPFEQYFTEKHLNNSGSAAISRLILGLETKCKRDFGSYRIRVMEDRAQSHSQPKTAVSQIAPKNIRPTLVL